MCTGKGVARRESAALEYDLAYLFVLHPQPEEVRGFGSLVVIGYRWEPERRFQLQCEIDAAFFLLYGISQDETEYILDTFSVLKRSEERKHGAYRTKSVVLETYEAHSVAASLGMPYESPLGPPRRVK